MSGRIDLCPPLAGFDLPGDAFIDDMGLKQLPKHSGEYLSEVIMRRYENRSTIMTSNRPLEEWGKLLCDVPIVTGHLKTGHERSK